MTGGSLNLSKNKYKKFVGLLTANTGDELTVVPLEDELGGVTFELLNDSSYKIVIPNWVYDCNAIIAFFSYSQQGDITAPQHHHYVLEAHDSATFPNIKFYDPINEIPVNVQNLVIEIRIYP